MLRLGLKVWVGIKQLLYKACTGELQFGVIRAQFNGIVYAV